MDQVSPSNTVVVQRIGRTCAGIAIAGGLVVLTGWLFQLPRFTDWLNVGISTMPNTALAVVLAGASLWFRSARPHRIARACAILSGSIGLLTLCEHAFDTDLGIDQALFQADWGQVGTTEPGRMGLPASVMLVILSTALVLSNFRRSARKAAAVGATTCIAIASLSIIGFLFGSQPLYVIPEITAIALNTALLLVVLSVGVITVLPDAEPMRTLMARSAAGAMVRRALLFLILVPVLIGMLRWQGEQAGLFDAAFGTALRTIVEAALLLGLLWWMAAAVGRYERKQRASERALRISEQRYRSFMQQSSEGIWRCELTEPMPLSLPVEAAIDHVYRHGYLAECNDAMARMYGYTRGDELVGAKLADLMPRSPDNEAYIGAFMRSGFRLSGGESEERDKDGETLYFSNNLVGIVEDGFLVRAWGTQLDITDRKRVDIALREADRRKDEFLATLAHELRNPLAPLVNGMQLLDDADDAAGDKDGDLRRMMKRQLQHLVRLIDDLMDISRINRGRIALRTERVELERVLSGAIESTAPAMQAADHTLETDLSEARVLLQGDVVRLTQVFVNLLHNAAKFTETGGRIRLRTWREGDEAIVTVEDNGMGLASEHLSSIFDMFSQVRTGQGHYRDGLGIGLSLVKRLVEMHGGSVEAISEGLGKGAAFRVRLPLIPGETDAGTDDRTAATASQGSVISTH